MVAPDFGGITLEKVEHAARKYHDTGYNDSYSSVYTTAIREKLLCDPDDDSVRNIIKFVNSWRNRTPQTALPELTEVLYRSVDQNQTLRDAVLEDPSLDEASLEPVQRIFEDLCNVERFGPTGASKFLGIIQPQLCVMWDGPIRRTLGYTGNTPKYSTYLLQMRRLAIEVLKDSRSRGIARPAEHISGTLGISPYFTLATFINHYVWVNITMPLRKKN